MWQYGILLAHRTVARRLSTSSLPFTIVGGLAVSSHMMALAMVLASLRPSFTAAQFIATAAVLMGTFALNNVLCTATGA
jgi:putative flippase GtrA